MPVREVITHGFNGLLVPMFDPAAIALRVIDVLATPRAAQSAMRAAARAQIIDLYALEKCLPRQLQLVRDATNMTH